jgi:hypothetical protein
VLEDPLVIGSMVWEAEIPRAHKSRGTPLDSAMRFSFPDQEIHPSINSRGRFMFEAPDGQTGYAGVVSLGSGVNRPGME